MSYIVRQSLPSSKALPWDFRAFEQTDFLPQPLDQGILEFPPRSRAIERIDRFTVVVERDVTAGNFLFATFRRHQLHQNTFRTWFPGLSSIEVQARGRILKDEARTPRGGRKIPVSTVPDEFELGLQYRQ